jgi:hypothetical protein
MEINQIVCYCVFTTTDKSANAYNHITLSFKVIL